MIAIRGINSSIAQSFIKIINDEVCEIGRDKIFPLSTAEKYLFCQGILIGKKRIDQTSDEIAKTYRINYSSIAMMCDSILESNQSARICVIGSESGIVGSYDEVYADSKRLLHHYVETKRIGAEQQLVGIAPSIIEDSNMTQKREDQDVLDKKRILNPKGRFLKAIEVARLVYFCLYVDKGYLNNVILRINGGIA